MFIFSVLLLTYYIKTPFTMGKNRYPSLYVVWPKNNRIDVRTFFFLQKITHSKHHPKCTPLPDPYIECSTVGSNAASRLLIAYSWPPSLLPSLHLRNRNWFLLTQTWSLEIIKVTWGLARWVRWMFQHGDLVLPQKRLDR